MNIKRFTDDGLSHFSYIISSGNQAVIIDPARNPEIYYTYLDEHDLKLKGVIETHPHADFVSSHAEISSEKDVPVYVSRKVGAQYVHEPFDEGDTLQLNNIRLRAMNTPGHSPDSISIVVEEEGKQKAVFTGDALFIGDVGRPDLRDDAGDNEEKKRKFARQLYYSTREKLMKLDRKITIYPAHGDGSLCGGGMSDKKSDTLENQLQENDALQPMSEEEFIDHLLEDKLFIPKYFSYNVALNIKGAPAYGESVSKVKRVNGTAKAFKPNALIVDARDEADFKKGHYPGAVNIMNGEKFETWLGSIVGPEEEFYLIAGNEKELEELIGKAAKIGYEDKIVEARVFSEKSGLHSSGSLNLEKFKDNKDDYTIVDLRNQNEVEEKTIFKNSLHIPLHELRERAGDIPQDKPIVVHCAGGYRSAAGFSILEAELQQTDVYDLSDDVEKFK